MKGSPCNCTAGGKLPIFGREKPVWRQQRVLTYDFSFAGTVTMIFKSPTQ
jgi:hypothetical protein